MSRSYKGYHLTPYLMDILTSYSRGVIQKKAGIPASVVHRVLRGKARLSEVSKSKIRRFHRSELRKEKYRIARSRGLTSSESKRVRSFNIDRVEKYVQLRSSGARVSDADRLSYASSGLVDMISRRLVRVANILSKVHEVKLKYILRGISLSDRNIDDWEVYVKEMGYVKK